MEVDGLWGGSGCWAMRVGHSSCGIGSACLRETPVLSLMGRLCYEGGVECACSIEAAMYVAAGAGVSLLLLFLPSNDYVL